MFALTHKQLSALPSLPQPLLRVVSNIFLEGFPMTFRFSHKAPLCHLLRNCFSGKASNSGRSSFVNSLVPAFSRILSKTDITECYGHQSISRIDSAIISLIFTFLL